VPSFVKDISEAEFQNAVLERSREVPVLVDFWAPWCGPCRTLGPLLEKAVEALNGRVELVKIDTDANPAIAAQFGIQGIPAVKAFRHGQVVDEFAGVLPVLEIAAFIARLVPSDSAEKLSQAMSQWTAGERKSAEEGLRALVDDKEAGNAASFHLAHLLAETSTPASQLRDLAEKVHPAAHEYTRVEALLALTSLIELAKPGATQDLEKAIAGNPKDHDSRLALAANLFTEGDVKGALDTLLLSVSRNPKHADGTALKSILAIFDHLEEPPAQPELVRDYRKQLQIVS
jgi:putative thioredoxin